LSERYKNSQSIFQSEQIPKLVLLGDPSREAIHNVANTLQVARNGAVGFIVGHYSPSMILRIAIIARTPAAVGVIAKLIISAADIVIVLDSRN